MNVHFHMNYVTVLCHGVWPLLFVQKDIISFIHNYLFLFHSWLSISYAFLTRSIILLANPYSLSNHKTILTVEQSICNKKYYNLLTKLPDYEVVPDTLTEHNWFRTSSKDTACTRVGFENFIFKNMFMIYAIVYLVSSPIFVFPLLILGTVQSIGGDKTNVTRSKTSDKMAWTFSFWGLIFFPAKILKLQIAWRFLCVSIVFF